MENTPITISTFGSCVTRDIFRISDKEHRFKTQGNTGFISSPISIFSKPPEHADLLFEKVNSLNFSNFHKRSVGQDLNKNSLDYLRENKGEYLVFSLAEIRLSVFKLNETAFTLNQLTSKLKNEIIDLGYQEHRTLSLPLDDILESIDKLCDEILKIYSPDKIILLKEMPCNACYSNGTIVYSESMDILTHKYPTSLFKIVNAYAEEKLKCNVVNMPDMQYVMINSKHTFGAYIFHYTDKVYECLYADICKIVFGSKYEAVKQQKLLELKQEYYSALKKTLVKSSVLSDDAINCATINSLPEYLDALAKLKNCIVVISIKDTAGSCFDENIQQKLQKLGLIENLVKVWTVGYIAVIKNRIPIHESKSERNGYEQYLGQVDYFNLDIISKSYRCGNLAQININGTDYAVNGRGLNIVVIDLQSGKVADSVAFDTHVKNFPCRRRNDFHLNEDMIRIDIRRLQNKLDSMSDKLNQ